MSDQLTLDFFTQRLQSLVPLNLTFKNDSATHIGHVGAASGGGHYTVSVVSEHFISLNRLQRHRLVYNCFSDFIPHRIHALNIETLTPEEWHAKQQGVFS